MMDSEFQNISRELLIAIDSNQIITDISSNCYQFFGYTSSDIIGTNINNYITVKLEIECNNTKNIELTLMSKRGESIYCDAFITYDEKCNAKISLINISKYKKIELWESRFRRMIENTFFRYSS